MASFGRSTASLERSTASLGRSTTSFGRSTTSFGRWAALGRSLVGLDRDAAKPAFAGFLTGKTLTADQIELVDLIVNHLTDRG